MSFHKEYKRNDDIHLNDDSDLYSFLTDFFLHSCKRQPVQTYTVFSSSSTVMSSEMVLYVETMLINLLIGIFFRFPNPMC